MAYTAWSVVFGEQPTAAKWNQLGTNDAGFKDGTNIDAGAIVNSKLAPTAVTSSKMDGAGFQFNIKTAKNTTAATPVNGANVNMASNGASLPFTLSGVGYALVIVSIATVSSSDFENKPLVYLNGTVQRVAGFNAAAGNASSRTNPRTFHCLITLPSGANTISAGINVASATSPAVPVDCCEITAIVLGNVTA